MTSAILSYSASIIPIPHPPEYGLDYWPLTVYTYGMEVDAAALEEEMDYLGDAAGGGMPPIGPVSGDRLQKVRYTHEAMIDLILANPGIHQNQLANYFGYSAPWISTVMQTDAFRAKMAERSAEIIDPVLRATIRERFEALVIRSVEVLQEKLSRPASMIPDNLALRAMELGAKSLGFGQAFVPIAPVVPPGHLNALAERLVALQSNIRRGTVDAQDASIIEA
jgi:hypothetical protein